MDNKTKTRFGANPELVKLTRKEFKPNGFDISVSDTKMLVDIVFKVIQRHYFSKVKNLTINGFGTFKVHVAERKYLLMEKKDKVITYRFNCSIDFKKKNLENFKKLSDE